MAQTLLLADDSVTIQRVIELTFADEDINVFAVSDGDQAIEKIDADPPDIVLVDVGMPGRSGFDVARYIKASPRLQHIPVLLLTGAFEPVDEATAASAGCDGVLAKPFEPQLVISRVKDLLGRSGASDLIDSAPALDHPTVVDAVDPVPAAQTPDVWGERPAVPVEAARPTQVARLDSYFAQLDEAFSSLSGGNPPAAEAPRVPASTPSPVADMIDWFGGAPGVPGAPGVSSTAPPDAALVAEPPAAAIDVPASEASLAEWAVDVDTPFDSDPAPSPDQVPEYQEPIASYLAAEPEPHYSDPEPHYSEPAPQHSEPASEYAASSKLLPLADAFDTILAAEQHEPTPLAAPAWPGTTANAAHARSGDAVLSEEAIEMITRRVIERLSDRVVRETVTDLVSAVAERLVREEIERIKASIQ